MKTLSIWPVVWEWIGPLAIEVLLIVGASSLAAVVCRSSVWRRTLWQVCFLALFGLVVCEVAGWNRETARWALGSGGESFHPENPSGEGTHSISPAPQAGLISTKAREDADEGLLPGGEISESMDPSPQSASVSAAMAEPIHHSLESQKVTEAAPSNLLNTGTQTRSDGFSPAALRTS